MQVEKSNGGESRFAQRLPSSGEVLKAFEAQAGAGSHRVLAAATELARGHLDQWLEEDRCRDHFDDDAVVAQAKRTIDRMNRARVDVVSRIDDWAMRCVLDSTAGVLHTETLGQLIDRFAIAWVRARQLASSADRDDSQRLAAVRAAAQLADLCDGYDRLTADLDRGIRRLPRWRTLKQYGGAQRAGRT